jgi:hypothetical protein
MASMFRGIIGFFDEIGIYDIVLPFLLVFTVVFAILEKTKVLGIDHIGGHDYTKKNLNAIVAFVTAFLVIASTKLVAIINQTLAHVALLLILSICFLLLIGSFYKEGEPVALTGGWRSLFMVIMFIGIILVGLNAVTLASGKSVLEAMYDFLLSSWSSNLAASVVFLVLIIGFILYVTHTPQKGGGSPAEHGGGHGGH